MSHANLNKLDVLIHPRKGLFKRIRRINPSRGQAVFRQRSLRNRFGRDERDRGKWIFLVRASGNFIEMEYLKNTQVTQGRGGEREWEGEGQSCLPAACVQIVGIGRGHTPTGPVKLFRFCVAFLRGCAAWSRFRVVARRPPHPLRQERILQKSDDSTFYRVLIHRAHFVALLLSFTEAAESIVHRRRGCRFVWSDRSVREIANAQGSSKGE